MTEKAISSKTEAERQEVHPNEHSGVESPLPHVDHRQRVGAERRERMRWRLLNSALKLVASKGHAAMSVDDVIREAGVSRGTFYKYFASPDVLIRELATEIASQIVRTDGISAPIEDRIRE